MLLIASVFSLSSALHSTLILIPVLPQDNLINSREQHYFYNKINNREENEGEKNERDGKKESKHQHQRHHNKNKLMSKVCDIIIK